jgi:hypothetical protein
MNPATVIGQPRTADSSEPNDRSVPPGVSSNNRDAVPGAPEVPWVIYLGRMTLSIT